MQKELIGDKGKPRLLAMGIDNVLAAVLAMLVAAKTPALSAAARVVTLCVVYLSYFFIAEGLWGRSLGKLATGLVVRGTDGSQCGWRRAGIRTVLRIIEVNPLLFGALPAALSVLWTKRKQRLGDILAGTVVVQQLQAASETTSAPVSRPDV